MSEAVNEIICGIDPVRFLLFCEQLRIPSKDNPFLRKNTNPEILVPVRLFRPQIYLFNEIMAGLRDECHLFFVLKARQCGTTTLGLAFILYWCFQHPGMVFTMINPDQRLMSYNRNMLSTMARDLEVNHPEWCSPVDHDNVALLSFKNRSQIVWLNANPTKGEGGLARGVGVLGTHGTELGEWRDKDAVNSWFASLSQNHPARFYLLEGTSKGPGLFKDYWIEHANEPIGGRSIFQGWWLHPLYDLDLEDKTHGQIYDAYWKAVPRLLREEESWWHQVKERYSYEVTETQIGWWRYMKKKKYQNNEAMLFQEYPPLPEYAWSYGSKNYVSQASVIVQKANVSEAKKNRRFFKFEYGTKFEDTAFIPVDPNREYYDLVLWDEPRVNDPLCRYIISLDPSHGANEKSDLAVVEIFRAYTDSCVQVGEFAMRDLPSYALAWVILELAGLYHCETRVCIELQGGGYSVNDELQRLAMELDQGYDPKLVQHFEKLQHYIYFRPDSVRRVSATYHWITGPRTKEVMLSRYRDLFERGMLEIRSQQLLKETQDTILDSKGEINPSKEDNRLMAAALGVMAYLQTIEYEIGADPTFSRAQSSERENKEEQGPTNANLLGARVGGWKETLLKRMEEEHQERRALQEKAEDGDWRSDYDLDSQRKFMS